MKYFKIKIGYDEHEFIPIDEKELPTAVYCFMTESKGIFNNGVCRGKDIIAISEDWHKAMGWNPTHVMENEDWAEIKSKGILKKYTGVIGYVKEKVQELMNNGQTNLISKMEVPDHVDDSEGDKRIGGMKSIGDILPKS
jgi:hypothetical protein